MNLPQNGRIVIIDNDESEAVPLIEALSRNGHPSSYFKGEVTGMPEKPILGIRILFLDMVLTQEQKNEKIILSAIKSALDRILSNDNGPFVTIAWTKRPELIPELEAYLKGRGFHFPILSWVKDDFKKTEGDGYDINKILGKLQESMIQKEALELCISWENLVHGAAGKTIDEFSRLKPFNEEGWNEKMTTIFWKLAKGYTGKQLDKRKKDEVIRNSFYSFNGAFIDTLYSEILRDRESPKINVSFESIIEDEDLETNGKINSKFILTEASDDKNIPGNVFDSLQIKNVVPYDLFEKKELTQSDGSIRETKYEDVKNDLKSKIKYIALEITPVCDYAQDKWKVNRFLPGIMWPVEYAQHIKKDAKFVYRSPVMRYDADNKFYHLVFDFRYFTSLPFEAIDGKSPIFRIKQEMLTDIQSQLAGHVNRTGIVSLE